MLSAAFAEHKVISPHAIKTLYLGETKIDNTLLGLIDYHNNNMKTVLSWGTLKNYFTTRKYVHLYYVVLKKKLVFILPGTLLQRLLH